MKLDVTTYSYKIDSLPEQLKGRRLAVLADVHDNTFGQDNEELLRRLRQMDPAAILIPGDMIIGSCKPSFDNALTLLRQLVMIAPVYYSSGNHEERMPDYGPEAASQYESYRDEVKKTGVVWLENESAELCPGVRIYGLSMGMEYYRKIVTRPMAEEYMGQLLGQKDSSEFTILMAHSPVYFSQYAAWGADLTVSGHHHGGMIRLPWIGGVISPQYHLFPKYDFGRFTEGDRQMILSRGLGSHSIDLRWFHNAPELVGIILEKL